MDRSESGEGVQHLINRRVRHAVWGWMFVRSDFNAINGDVNGGNHSTHMVDIAFKGGSVSLAPTDTMPPLPVILPSTVSLSLAVSNGVVNVAFSSASTS